MRKPLYGISVSFRVVDLFQLPESILPEFQTHDPSEVPLALHDLGP